MNGTKFLLDTNIILYILGGDEIMANYLFNKVLYTSIICEIELLSYKSISLNEENKIKNFLSQFRIISIDNAVKEIAIQLRKNYTLKVPVSAAFIASSLQTISVIKGVTFL